MLAIPFYYPPHTRVSSCNQTNPSALSNNASHLTLNSSILIQHSLPKVSKSSFSSLVKSTAPLFLRRHRSSSHT